MNSDLLDPQQTKARVVPPVAITRPLPLLKAETTKYYHLSVATASMHRGDGKKLAFVHGVFATDDLHDQEYLDTEIAAGNSYLSAATALQIDDYKMRINPRKTIEEQVTADLEPKIRAELEEKIRREMQEATNRPAQTDAEKLAGSSTAGSAAQVIDGANFRGSIVGSTAVKDATAGSGTSALTAQQKLDAMKTKK